MPAVCFASWTGPQVIVRATWGSGTNQFYFKRYVPEDAFPKEFGVDKNGTIVIPDWGNYRVVFYNSDGTINKIISKPAGLPPEDSNYGWPEDFAHFSDGNSFAITCDHKKIPGGLKPLYKCILDYNGTIVAKLGYGEILPIQTGFVLYKGKQYFLYSSTGTLLKSYSSQPLELGLVDKESRKPDGSYIDVIRFPDTTFSITVPDQNPDNFLRDGSGNLYVIQRFVDYLYRGTPNKQSVQHYRAIRYNFCSKEVARLDLPKDVETIISPASVVEKIWRVDEGYGQPVIATNGDVYTWKRTPDTYSIIKWTWVDDPNIPTGPDAPTGLSLMPSLNGIYLNWTASPSDPGCVTGYEVARATTSGGVYSTVGTVNAGLVQYNDTTATAGTTYYYKVRAVAGTEYSTYTAAVSGKR